MNDQPLPSSPPDADDVAKGFGQASETTMFLSDVAKLLLACQRAGVCNPYDEIPDKDAATLYRSPDELPPALRMFVLWQQNILKLDIQEIAETQIPKGIKTKYDVKGTRLAEMARDAERAAVIDVFQDELERYFQKFREVRAILEAAEDRFITIEDVLLRAESLDDTVISRVHGEKDALEQIRKQLCDIRAVLEDVALPDIISFEKAPETARALMVQLSDINVTLRENIRRYQADIDETGS